MKIYNLYLSLRLRLRLLLGFLSNFNLIYSPTYHSKGETLLKSFKRGEPWGLYYRGNIQAATIPKDGVFRCRAKSVEVGDRDNPLKTIVFPYSSDKISSRFRVTIPFKAQVDITYLKLTEGSWDAPLWFFAEHSQRDEIDVVEVWGDKFASALHWGSFFNEKDSSSGRFKMTKDSIQSFGVDVGLEYTKFYYQNILYRIEKTPLTILGDSFYAVINAGANDNIEDLEYSDKNVFKVMDLMIEEYCG